MRRLIPFFTTIFVAVLAISAISTSFASAESSPAGLSAREIRVQERLARRTRVRAQTSSLSDVCTNVSNLNGLLVKITAGGHIGSGDARYPGWSIICAGKCVSFPAKVYHCDGSTAWSMGYYGRWAGNGKARGYCAAGGAGKCYVSATRAANKAKRCNGAVYLDTDGGRGKSCMRFNVNSNRNGSV